MRPTKADIRRIITNMCYAFAEQDRHNKERRERKEHSFIPSNSGFLLNIEKILKREKISKTDIITDLGCGISPILIYLSYLGYEVLKGVDINKNHIKVLNSYHTLNINASCHDIKDFTNTRYLSIIKNSKVIYMYMPLKDEKQYIKLMQDVLYIMTKGSILISFYGPKLKDVPNTKIVTFKSKDSIYPINYYKKL